MKIRDASVTVRPTWVTIEDMDFPRLAKLSLPGIKEGMHVILTQIIKYYKISVFVVVCSYKDGNSHNDFLNNNSS